MKICLGLVFLFFLTLAGKEYAVKLTPVPGEEQVFFLDLRGTGADSSTFRLTDDRGRELPFSFDMRIFRPRIPGKYYRAPDGFYSKETAPAAENRYLHPGWLSFRAVPGAKFYTLTFRDGAAETIARPNPAVRAWWIELMKDPEFRDLKKNGLSPKIAKTLPGGGIEVSRPFRIPRKAAVLDERSRGRRILGLFRCAGNITYFGFFIRNEILPKTPALSCYFKTVPGEITDIYAEGVVSTKPGDLYLNKNYIAAFHYIKGTTQIYRLSVQFPPSEKSVGVQLHSDLLNVGDMVNFSVCGLGFPNTIPFTSGGISGLRAGIWNGTPEIAYILFDMKGGNILSGRGKSISLTGVTPGKYRLQTLLFVDGIETAKQEFPITVQKGAF